MNDASHSSRSEGGIPTRVVEMVVALIIFALGVLVVFDSYRLGSKWGSDGPESGYFPFYIGLLLCISAVVVLAQALVKRGGVGDLFVTWGPLRQVLIVLIPAIVYVGAVQVIGLYLASAIYITVFMTWLGHYSWLRSLLVGFGVNALFFLMFEVWFRVPLFKGALDPLGFLGY